MTLSFIVITASTITLTSNPLFFRWISKSNAIQCIINHKRRKKKKRSNRKGRYSFYQNRRTLVEFFVALFGVTFTTTRITITLISPWIGGRERKREKKRRWSQSAPKFCPGPMSVSVLTIFALPNIFLARRSPGPSTATFSFPGGGTFIKTPVNSAARRSREAPTTGRGLRFIQCYSTELEPEHRQRSRETWRAFPPFLWELRDTCLPGDVFVRTMKEFQRQRNVSRCMEIDWRWKRIAATVLWMTFIFYFFFFFWCFFLWAGKSWIC